MTHALSISNAIYRSPTPIFSGSVAVPTSGSIPLPNRASSVVFSIVTGSGTLFSITPRASILNSEYASVPIGLVNARTGGVVGVITSPGIYYLNDMVGMQIFLNLDSLSSGSMAIQSSVFPK